MRRVGWTLVAIMVLAATLLVAAFTIHRKADPMLWPPRAGARTIEVFVVSNGYHTGLALPREALAEFASGRGYPALNAVAQRFSQFPFIEFGRGEANFYRSTPTIGDVAPMAALRALFWPGNTALVHVVGLPAAPARVFASADIVPVTLSMAGFDQMLAKLDASFVPPQGGVLADAGRGLYGTSLFYPAVGTFNLFNVCNHWIAQLLHAGGLPSAPLLDTFATGLLFNLRWRGGLRAS